MLREFFKRHRKIDRGVQTDITGDFLNTSDTNKETVQEIKVSKISEANFLQLRENSIRTISGDLFLKNNFRFLQPKVYPEDDPYFFPSPDYSTLYFDEYCSLKKNLLTIFNFPNPEGPGSMRVTVGHIRKVFFQEQNGCLVDYFSVSNYGRFGKVIWAKDDRRACFCCCSSFRTGTNIIIEIGLPNLIGFTVEDPDLFLSSLKPIVKSTVMFYDQLP